MDHLKVQLMKMRSVAALALSAAVGCVSVNVYLNFPALEKALDKWEQEVRGEGTPPPQKMDAGDRMEMQGGPDINLETPAIKKIKKSRSDRFGDIARLMDQGVAAEGQACLLSIRDEALSALAAKPRSDARKLIQDENDDRKKLISEIMRANDISGADAERQVRDRYFKVLRRQARIGWYVEYESGRTRQKTADDQKKDERER